MFLKIDMMYSLTNNLYWAPNSKFTIKMFKLPYLLYLLIDFNDIGVKRKVPPNSNKNKCWTWSVDHSFVQITIKWPPSTCCCVDQHGCRAPAMTSTKKAVDHLLWPKPKWPPVMTSFIQVHAQNMTLKWCICYCCQSTCE